MTTFWILLILCLCGLVYSIRCQTGPWIPSHQNTTLKQVTTNRELQNRLIYEAMFKAQVRAYKELYELTGKREELDFTAVLNGKTIPVSSPEEFESLCDIKDEHLPYLHVSKAKKSYYDLRDQCLRDSYEEVLDKLILDGHFVSPESFDFKTRIWDKMETAAFAGKKCEIFRIDYGSEADYLDACEWEARMATAKKLTRGTIIWAIFATLIMTGIIVFCVAAEIGFDASVIAGLILTPCISGACCLPFWIYYRILKSKIASIKNKSNNPDS